MARLLSILAAFGCLFYSAAHAEPWPTKPIRLVAPVGAGSGADLVARTIAEKLSERLAQQVIVDNRPGASGNIGMEVAARAAPDGYTLLYALTTFAINPHIYKLAFDPLKDFVPVVLIARYQFVLLARPGFPARNVNGIVKLARDRPGTLTCGYAGGIFYMGCALLSSLAKVEITPVPYKSAPQIMSDLLGGRIDLVINASNAVDHAVAKGAIPIAMTSRRQPRNPLGDVPAIGETLKGFDLASWQGIVAPAGTPLPVIQQLNKELRAVLEERSLRSLLESWDMEVVGSSPQFFGDFIEREHARYERIVRETGIKVE